MHASGRLGNTPELSPEWSLLEPYLRITFPPPVKKRSSLSLNCIAGHVFPPAATRPLQCAVICGTPVAPRCRPLLLPSREPPHPWTSVGQRGHNSVTSDRSSDAENKTKQKKPKAFLFFVFGFFFFLLFNPNFENHVRLERKGLKLYDAPTQSQTHSEVKQAVRGTHPNSSSRGVRADWGSLHHHSAVRGVVRDGAEATQGLWATAFRHQLRPTGPRAPAHTPIVQWSRPCSQRALSRV